MEKKYCKFICFSLIVFTLFGFTGCKNQKNETANEKQEKTLSKDIKFQKYDNPSLSLSMEFPTNWMVFDKKVMEFKTYDETILSQMGEKANVNIDDIRNSLEKIDVIFYDTNQPTTNLTLTREATKSSNNDLKNIKVQRQLESIIKSTYADFEKTKNFEAIEINGKFFLILSYKTNIGSDNLMEYKMAMSIENGFLHKFTFATLPENLEEQWPVFKHMLGSLDFHKL